MYLSRYELKTPDGTWYLDVRKAGFDLKYQGIGAFKQEVAAGTHDSNGVHLDSFTGKLPQEEFKNLHDVLGALLQEDKKRNGNS